MARKKGKCFGCHRVKRIKAFGLCNVCYHTLYRKRLEIKKKAEIKNKLKMAEGQIKKVEALEEEIKKMRLDIIRIVNENRILKSENKALREEIKLQEGALVDLSF